MNNQQSLVERLTQIIGQYSVQCSNGGELAPSLALAEVLHEVAALEAQLKPQGELPELPTPAEMIVEGKLTFERFTAEQMRAYGQLCRASRPTDAQPTATESIVDADGLPALMKDVMWTHGSPEALKALYDFINAWADKRVAAAQVKESAETLPCAEGSVKALTDEIAHAQAEMATWSDEKKQSVQLEGTDRYFIERAPANALDDLVEELALKHIAVNYDLIRNAVGGDYKKTEQFKRLKAFAADFLQAAQPVPCQHDYHWFGDQVTARRCVKCNKLEDAAQPQGEQK